MSAPETVVYVQPGDRDSAAVISWLGQRGVPHTVRDVSRDASAAAVLFGRLRRLVTPVVQQGERWVVGYDPIQLARLVPATDTEEGPVSFGAAVRSVSGELARERGLPWRFGVEVGPVHEGSPAATAGVRTGDLITHIGAYTLDRGAEQFRAAVAARVPGDTMRMTVRRAGEEIPVSVEFPRAPDAESR